MGKTRVIDAATGAMIGESVAEGRSLWAQWRGLMLRPRPGPGQGIRIEPCRAIHTFAVRFPIDAVFYDRDGRVTRVARGLPAWRGIAFGGRSARGVLELPEGTAATLQPGSRLQFEPPTDVRPHVRPEPAS